MIGVIFFDANIDLVVVLSLTMLVMRNVSEARHTSLTLAYLENYLFLSGYRTPKRFPRQTSSASPPAKLI